MARNPNATKILVDWQEGLGGEDFLRGLVERVAQQALEAEMSSFLGAENDGRGDIAAWSGAWMVSSMPKDVCGAGGGT